jgi:hypothetical protein
MKVSKSILFLVIAVVLSAAIPSNAALLEYEGFDYGTDQYLGQPLPPHNGGSGWDGPWVDALGAVYPEKNPQLSQDSVSLSYGTTTSGLTPTGGRVDHTVPTLPDSGFSTKMMRPLGTSYDPEINNTIYVSFLMNQFDTDLFGNAIGAGLTNSNGNGRVYAGINENMDVFIGYSASSYAAQTYTDMIVEDRTYLFVLKAVTTAGIDTVSLKVYDTTTDVVGAEPVGDWTLEKELTIDALTHWTQETKYRANHSQIDELRVGESWLDVTGVPEPATVSLLAFGGCLLLRRRRK